MMKSHWLNWIDFTAGTTLNSLSRLFLSVLSSLSTLSCSPFKKLFSIVTAWTQYGGLSLCNISRTQSVPVHFTLYDLLCVCVCFANFMSCRHVNRRLCSSVCRSSLMSDLSGLSWSSLQSPLIQLVFPFFPPLFMQDSIKISSHSSLLSPFATDRKRAEKSRFLLST